MGLFYAFCARTLMRSVVVPVVVQKLLKYLGLYFDRFVFDLVKHD
mgnify:CR=1 FL=1